MCRDGSQLVHLSFPEPPPDVPVLHQAASLSGKIPYRAQINPRHISLIPDMVLVMVGKGEQALNVIGTPTALIRGLNLASVEDGLDRSQSHSGFPHGLEPSVSDPLLHQRRFFRTYSGLGVLPR